MVEKWLFVEWVDSRNLFPDYDVISSSTLLENTPETELYTGNMPFFLYKSLNIARKAKILKISVYKSYIEDMKIIVDAQRRMIENSILSLMKDDALFDSMTEEDSQGIRVNIRKQVYPSPVNGQSSRKRIFSFEPLTFSQVGSTVNNHKRSGCSEPETGIQEQLSRSTNSTPRPNKITRNLLMLDQSVQTDANAEFKPTPKQCILLKESESNIGELISLLLDSKDSIKKELNKRLRESLPNPQLDNDDELSVQDQSADLQKNSCFELFEGAGKRQTTNISIPSTLNEQSVLTTSDCLSSSPREISTKTNNNSLPSISKEKLDQTTSESLLSKSKVLSTKTNNNSFSTTSIEQSTETTSDCFPSLSKELSPQNNSNSPSASSKALTAQNNNNSLPKSSKSPPAHKNNTSLPASSKGQSAHNNNISMPVIPKELSAETNNNNKSLSVTSKGILAETNNDNLPSTSKESLTHITDSGSSSTSSESASSRTNKSSSSSTSNDDSSSDELSKIPSNQAALSKQ